jgi:hypothetical protein
VFAVVASKIKRVDLLLLELYAMTQQG